MSRRLLFRPGDRQGNAAVEFALIAPVLMVLIASLWDYGNLVNTSTKLRNAARAGVQYAMTHASDTSGIQDTVLGALNAAPGDVTIQTAQACECSGAGADCSTACADGTPKEVFMTVAVTKSTSSILPSSDLVLPASVTGTATFRIQ